MATVKVTRAMAAAALREVDWTKVDAMTDADIARQVADNPDAGAILPDGAAAAARVRFVRKKTGLSQPDFAVRFGMPVFPFTRKLPSGVGRVVIGWGTAWIGLEVE